MTESQRVVDTKGWSDPLPEKVPRPTYYPVIFALGCVFMMFGIVTLWLMSVVGAVLFVIALIGWIGEMRHDQRNEV